MYVCLNYMLYASFITVKQPCEAFKLVSVLLMLYIYNVITGNLSFTLSSHFFFITASSVVTVLILQAVGVHPGG